MNRALLWYERCKNDETTTLIMSQNAGRIEEEIQALKLKKNILKGITDEEKVRKLEQMTQHLNALSIKKTHMKFQTTNV